MKEKITSLVLVLVVAMSMTVGASAASYIPDDVTYQNLNGQQLAIKTYTLLPDQDPADLYEEDFEHDGFLYSMSDIIKEEQHFQEENLHTEVVTVTTASSTMAFLPVLCLWTITRSRRRQPATRAALTLSPQPRTTPASIEMILLTSIRL